MSRDDETTEKHDDGDRELDQRVTEYLKLGVPAGTLACAVAAGYAQGPSAVVLVLAGGALVAVIAIFWASIRTLVGETPLSGADAYALGAPRAEEEQKRAVLRALKDLEFERSVGKISDEDYQALVSKYRAEAKRLLRVLDEESRPERDKVEVLVRARLRREGLTDADEAPPEKPAEADEKADEKPTEADEKREKARPERKKAKAGVTKASGPKVEAARPEAARARVKCVDCGTTNDTDAVFCKKCGARQGPVVGDDEKDDVAEEPGKQEASS